MNIVDGKILCTTCLRWRNLQFIVRKSNSKSGYSRICRDCKKKYNERYAATARMPRLVEEQRLAPVRAAQHLVELDARAAVAAANTNLALYDQLLAREMELVDARIKLRKKQYQKRIYNVKGHAAKVRAQADA